MSSYGLQDASESLEIGLCMIDKETARRVMCGAWSLNFLPKGIMYEASVCSGGVIDFELGCL